MQHRGRQSSSFRLAPKEASWAIIRFRKMRCVPDDCDQKAVGSPLSHASRPPLRVAATCAVDSVAVVAQDFLFCSALVFPRVCGVNMGGSAAAGAERAVLFPVAG